MSDPRLLHWQGAARNAATERRIARLIAAFGPRVTHTVVGSPDDEGAGGGFPPLAGFPFPRRLLRIARAMLGHDLVLTYGDGAIWAVLAHTLFEQALGLPPLVHHQDDGAAWADSRKPVRTWMQRIALAGVQGLVVHSVRRETAARQVWQLPRRKVHRIAPGIAVERYGQRCEPDALPRVIKRAGEFWLGTIMTQPQGEAGAAQRAAALLEPFAALPPEWQLVVLGDSGDRDAIRRRAVELGLGHRVHLPGVASHLANHLDGGLVDVLGLFDLFMLPPCGTDAAGGLATWHVIEAMAAGLAVVAPDCGEIAATLAEENRAGIVPPDCAPQFAAVLAELAADPARRQAIGGANRTRALAEYDEARMIEAYRAVYAGVLGTASFP